MAGSYNHIVLVGRLVADPELRQTQDGTPVTSFRIAVNRPKGRSGQEQTERRRMVAVGNEMPVATVEEEIVPARRPEPEREVRPRVGRVPPPVVVVEVAPGVAGVDGEQTGEDREQRGPRQRERVAATRLVVPRTAAA